MISLDRISKSFAGAVALREVSLAIAAGTVHGLLGENGAGKSTLMNILFGLVQPDSGSIAVAGKPARITSPRVAQRLGIGMVHQHFKLVPTLSVLDNLELALATGIGVIDRRALAERIAAIAESLRWSLDLRARIDSLSVGQQQRVEIIKALAAGGGTDGGTRALILDEPTAVLTPQEVAELIPALRALAARGTAVIFISHKLIEVERACDQISILRRGRIVHSGPIAELDREEMAERMLGASPALPTRTPSPAADDAPMRIQLDAVSVLRRGAPAALDRVSLTVRAGEIVGVAGVDGNGQGPLAQVVIGMIAPASGTVRVTAPLARMGVIPEDRQRQALVLPLSITQNLMLKHRKDPRFSRWGWLRHAACSRHASELVTRFDVRGSSLVHSAASLSGGNQQKLVLARELHHQPEVIVGVNPTRGLDLGATAAVMRRLLEARDRGAAVLLIHSDLDELLALSDRVLVLHAGRLLASSWPQCDRETIGRLMLGLPVAAA